MAAEIKIKERMLSVEEARSWIERSRRARGSEGRVAKSQGTGDFGGEEQRTMVILFILLFVSSSRRVIKQGKLRPWKVACFEI
jgi:isoprenylcysteine carboxyl methyltransferase (ICMT) family protein YpbQ